MFCMFLNFWNQDTNVLEGKFLWPLLQIDQILLPYYDLKNQQIMEMLGLTISHANLLQLKTDSEKRSVTDSETWGSTEELKKPEEDFDSSVDSSGKWKGLPSGLSEESEKGGQKTSLSVSQTGSWRRGMTAQVGTTQSRHKAGTSALKTPGRKLLQFRLQWL